MKIKDGYILREVADSYLVVAIGSAVKEFKGVITLNETGAFLWKALEKGTDEQSLVSLLLESYEVEKEQAEKDVSAFIEKIKGANLLK